MPESPEEAEAQVAAMLEDPEVASFYRNMGTGVCIATMAIIMTLMKTIETPRVLLAAELHEEVNMTLSTTVAKEMVAEIAREQDVSMLNKLTYATIGAAALFLGQQLRAYGKSLIQNICQRYKDQDEDLEYGACNEDDEESDWDEIPAEEELSMVEDGEEVDPSQTEINGLGRVQGTGWQRFTYDTGAALSAYPRKHLPEQLQKSFNGNGKK